ncbi:MAG: transporter substrate-binding domain-containing protein [Arenimonas sp.]
MKLRKPITHIVAALLAAVFSFAATPIAVAKPVPRAGANPTPLAAANPVHLASLEWAPYIGSRLPDQGYVGALVRAAFADQGLAVKIQIYPWARALQMARTGAVDGLVPEYFNRSRESEFEFSAPFPGGPLALYKRRGDAIGFSADPVRNQDAALRALKARRFGVVRGYLNTPVFDAANYLIKEEASDDATNLRKLVYGRIDLAVIDRRVAEHLIRTEYPNYVKKIEPMQPALAELPLFIAFSRKSPRMSEALAAFNRGLAAMRADGRLAALHQRYMVKAPNGR